MKAIILAAGRGSRLHSLTDDRPKCLVELMGRPLLDYQLQALRKAGAGPIAIVTGYRAEQLRHRADHAFHNPRWASSSILASLLCAEPWLSTADCLISYSDIFYPSGFPGALMGAGGDIALAYDPDWLDLWSRRFDEPLSDAESFLVEPGGWLADIGRKNPPQAEVQGQYIGLIKTTPSGWGAARAILDKLDGRSLDTLDLTAFFALLLRHGTPIQAVPVRGVWGEVDSGTDLALYGDLHGTGLLDLG